MRKKLLAAGTAIALLLPMMSAQAFAAIPFDAPKAKVVKSVNFRTGPSTEYDRIRFLQTGESLDVLERINDNWLSVRDADGKSGYVSASETYITLYTQRISVEPNATIASTVNFRTGPSTDFSRIRYLQPGEEVLILEKTNDYWYKIAEQNGTIGYVSTSPKYITTGFGQVGQDDQSQPTEADTKEEAAFPSTPNGTIVKSVSFRTGPSTDHDRIRYLQAGELVVIIDKMNEYWYKAIDRNGVVGFLSTSPTYIDSRYMEAYKQLPPAVAVEKVIDAGMAYWGTPYEFGSSRYDTSTFDCSDFVRQAFLDSLNLQLPGDSRSQAAYVKGIGKTTQDWRQLQRGDLMFFMSYKGSKASDYSGIDKQSERITHVGIYLGDGKVLHTYSASSGGVRIDSIAGKSWEYRFVSGGSAF